MAQESLLLQTVSRDVILPILMKLPNRELCRMRRTCSLLDEVAQENEVKLSKRRMFLTRVSFTNQRLDRNPMFPANNRKEAHRKQFIFDDIEDYKKQMSGICVHLMSVYGIMHHITRDKMQRFFNELKPTVDILYLEDVPPRAAVLLLQKINFRTMCVVKQMPRSNQKSTKAFIEIMAQTPCHAKIGLQLENVKKEYFELFKNFREIQSGDMGDIQFGVRALLWWIKELSSFEDVGHLKRICLECQAIDYPALQMIWRADEHQFKQVFCTAPRFVAQVDMKNHIMFIIAVKGPKNFCEKIFMVFVNKNSTSKWVDVLEGIEDVAPILREQVPILRSMLGKARNEAESVDCFKKMFDGVVEKGFSAHYPFTSDNVCFRR